MYTHESYILFNTVDKKNTDITIETVIDYCSKHIDILTIFVSSTTGFTIYSLLNRLENLNKYQLFVFTQYLDIKHNMSINVREHLETLKIVQGVFDVPPKYLNQEIGQAGVESLRELSHGIKVCIELAHFAQTKQLLNENQKFIVISGRIEGADTAVVFQKKQSGVKLIKILCFSSEE